jgi:glycosyltransferase involved in cell wall biosynthesis
MRMVWAMADATSEFKAEMEPDPWKSVNNGTVPLISIIVAVFNGKTTLQQCVNSVAQQTYPNKELIIIDGGSEDGTVDLIKVNREKIAYWISEPDRGIYSALNKGVAQAQGEWICFLGADDYFWDAQVLERLVRQLQKLPPDIRVAYGQTMMVNTDGTNLYSLGEPWEKINEQFMQINCIPHQGVMHRRSLFEQHGQFDESFRIAGDYELLLRELKTGNAVFIPEVIVAAQRIGGISTHGSNYFRTLREYSRAQRMHGRLLPGKVLLNVMATEFSRRLLWKVFGEKFARRLLDLRRRLKGLPPHWTKT